MNIGDSALSLSVTTRALSWRDREPKQPRFYPNAHHAHAWCQKA